ncbi:MAG: CPBP family intramembrane metalloprotease [Chlamydiae bacterium]|nr:CPBP family intramembrane metalloprotease [Chlamydiota bacterium]
MESPLIFAAFVLYCLTFLSLWIRKEPKIWGTFLGLTLLIGGINGNILWPGLISLAALTCLWVFYVQKQNIFSRTILFFLIILMSFGFLFHWFPGFNPVTITEKFTLSFEKPLLGFFPLLLMIPLAKSLKDWKIIFKKGIGIGLLGVGVLATIAVMVGSVQLQFKLPSYALTRYASNLFLTAIPEEAFFRGFVQGELTRFLPKSKTGKIIALFLSSIIFTLAHVYWTPSGAILGFVFLAGLLYGSVYLISGKIEGAIITHFLLNFVHMTFFSYHAM